MRFCVKERKHSVKSTGYVVLLKIVDIYATIMLAMTNCVRRNCYKKPGSFIYLWNRTTICKYFRRYDSCCLLTGTFPETAAFFYSGSFCTVKNHWWYMAFDCCITLAECTVCSEDCEMYCGK